MRNGGRKDFGVPRSARLEGGVFSDVRDSLWARYRCLIECDWSTLTMDSCIFPPAGVCLFRGLVDGKALLSSVHFYDQLLLSVDLTVSHYPLDIKQLSEKIEAAAKDFHDRLLERLLGPPSRIIDSPSSFPKNYPALDRSLEWSFPWGTVSSVFVGQSCSSPMLVRYGNRGEEAYQLDRRRGIMS
jgi:hypothetical protein